MSHRTAKTTRSALVGLILSGIVLLGAGCPFGLSFSAFLELKEANVDKYLGEFTPALSENLGPPPGNPTSAPWVRHTFDAGDDEGPVCIDGSPFTAFSRDTNPHKVLIFLQGGGACWQNFYFCTQTADVFPPAFGVAIGQASGIWDDAFPDGQGGTLPNPFSDYSVVYSSYCDGSVFSGDNTVIDPVWTAVTGAPKRFHRGLRNVSAVVDLAKDLYPYANDIVVAGSSAGGVGSVSFTPFLVRFKYGNFVSLRVFNDAGPIAINLEQTEAIELRRADWDYEQFIPASCTDCSATDQGTGIVKYRLEEDKGIREAFYSTDQDDTNTFFIDVPQSEYRDLILPVHGEVVDLFPNRYRTFIKVGTLHTALQRPEFYFFEIDGTPLNQWTEDFLKFFPGPSWQNLIEEP